VGDVAAPPLEQLGTPIYTLDIHATDSHQILAVCGFPVICGELVCWCVQLSYIFMLWLDGRVVFGLALSSSCNTMVSSEPQ